MQALLAFAGKRWPFILLALAAVATWATLMHLRSEIERMEIAVENAEEAEALARSAAAIERGNADRLAGMIAQAQATARAERAARMAASQQREIDRSDNQEADAQLGETIIIERQADVTLDQCLSYELPDSILRDLP